MLAAAQVKVCRQAHGFPREGAPVSYLLRKAGKLGIGAYLGYGAALSLRPRLSYKPCGQQRKQHCKHQKQRRGLSCESPHAFLPFSFCRCAFHRAFSVHVFSFRSRRRRQKKSAALRFLLKNGPRPHSSHHSANPEYGRYSDLSDGTASAKSLKTQKKPIKSAKKTVLFVRNTVMAVVQDSNLISFLIYSAYNFSNRIV